MGNLEQEAIRELEDQEAGEVFSLENRNLRMLILAAIMGMMLLWQVANFVGFLHDATLSLTGHAEEDKADAAEWGRVIGIEHGYHKGFRKGYTSRMSEEQEQTAEREKAKQNGDDSKTRKAAPDRVLRGE